MSTALAPARGLTLYEIEDELMAWANTLELADTDEQRDEIQQRVGTYLQAATEKRDRFAQFLAHLEQQEELAKLEEERLANRRRAIVRMREQLEAYAISVMEAIGVKKLQGNTSTLSLRLRPASVLIQDAAAIPPEYKRISLSVNSEAFAIFLARLTATSLTEIDAFGAIFRIEGETISKTDISRDLKAGVEVPGADLALGRNSLVRK